MPFLEAYCTAGGFSEPRNCHDATTDQHEAGSRADLSRALVNLAKLFWWTAACLRVVEKRQTALTLTLLHGCATPENSGFKHVSTPESTVCVNCNMTFLQSLSNYAGSGGVRDCRQVAL